MQSPGNDMGFFLCFPSEDVVCLFFYLHWSVISNIFLKYFWNKSDEGEKGPRNDLAPGLEHI